MADKSTRDQAVKAVRAYFADNLRINTLSRLDLDKLNMGIFFCYWMSDKPNAQQSLSTELADLVLTITSDQSSLRFLRSFWETTVTEWPRIDRLRADKYYMLLRKYVNSSFRLLQRSGWSRSVCEEYNDILLARGCPLCPDDNKVPTSIGYHLADVYLDELEKVVGADTTALVPLQTLLHPFFVLATQTRNPKTLARLETALISPLFSALREASMPDLPANQPRQRESKRQRLDEAVLTSLTKPYASLISHACLEAGEDSAQALTAAILHSGLLRRLFDEASKQDARDANRRRIYSLWKEAMDDKNSETFTCETHNGTK